MPNLITGNIDINNKDVLLEVKQAIQRIVSRPEMYFKLNVTQSCSLNVVGFDEHWLYGGGWYIILADKTPIYVGQASYFRHRLSGTGGQDNFNNLHRKSDSKRNFIKKFIANGFIDNPRVCLVPSKQLIEELSVSDMSKLDFNNIEKLIDILRGLLLYL